MEGGKSRLESFRVGDIPDMYYVPNFLSVEQQERLLDKIYGSNLWQNLNRRRLQQWGGVPEAKGMIASPLPDWLAQISDLLLQQGYTTDRCNHVLINEYQPGQGIMPHEDGPLYTPHFAIVSLKSALLLDFYPKKQQHPDQDDDDTYVRTRVCSLWLEPGSVVIISNAAYTHYLHGIEERTCDVLDDNVINLRDDNIRSSHHDRQLRVSLTIRHVKKTISGTKLFGTRK